LAVFSRFFDVFETLGVGVIPGVCQGLDGLNDGCEGSRADAREDARVVGGRGRRRGPLVNLG